MEKFIIEIFSQMLHKKFFVDSSLTELGSNRSKRLRVLAEVSRGCRNGVHEVYICSW